MGERIFTGIMIAIAIALVGWVTFRQLDNRRIVGENLGQFREEIIAAVPDGPMRDRAEKVVTRYVESATGFERTVSRSELFLSRHQLAAAAADSVLSLVEVSSLLDSLEVQMNEATTTIVRPGSASAP